MIVLWWTSRVTRPGQLNLFSADMIFPTMLTPHRTTNPATTGILTQLSEDISYLWFGLLGQTQSSCNQASRLATFPRLGFLTSKCPLGSREGNYFLAYVHSQMNPHTCVPNLVLIHPAVWQISHIFNF